LTAITTAQALASAHTLGLDRLDAQLLLLHALGKSDTDRAWLLAHDGDALSASLADMFNALCLRRAAGEPLAYIVGYKEFFGLRLAVDARVLIPRPDTETLVQWALDVVQDVPEPDVLDLGTGSGAVAIAIAHTRKARVTAIDFSQDALTVAAENAKRVGVDVQFGQSNWFEKVSGHYHLIASNPPYIADADSHLAALAHEPLSALTAGCDGLGDIREIIENAPDRLKPGGWLLLEHGYDQANAVCGLLVERGFAPVKSRIDLAGIARCSGGQWRRSNSGIIAD
jgi:release factor glutamine methyltransferase